MEENVADTEKSGFLAIVGSVLVFILISIWWVGISVLMFAGFAWVMDHLLGLHLPIWAWLFFV